ncbi:hypothetical protein LguiA_008903 [Lonicera macranthoides]
MATASATLTPLTATATVTSSKRTRRSRVNYITGLNSFNGLKAQNSVTSMGLPVCTEQSFANVVNSLRAPSKGRKSGGGAAMGAQCSAVGEIFKIAVIMNALTLVGVAVGFVLLRIEAYVEENE